jgi:hypothetical protein
VSFDRHAVPGDGDVRLDRRDADLERSAECGERILRREAARAAMAFEIECTRVRRSEREGDEQCGYDGLWGQGRKSMKMAADPILRQDFLL